MTTSALPNGLAGSAYSVQLSATGGAGPITWRVAAGVLPNGLGLSAGGVLSGVPTAGGTSTFTVEASSAGQVGARQLSVNIDVTPVTVTTSVLPNAFAGSAYAVQLTASGGTGTFSWSLAGPPPAGLTLSPSGLLSGNPTTEGTNSISVQASSAGQIGVKQLSLLVAAAACAPQGAQPPDPAPATAWVWAYLGLPTGLASPAVSKFRIDPEDANTWYANGLSGTFVSHNSGQTWAHPLSGFASPTFVEFAPGNSCTVYVADNDPGGPGRLRRSVDRGVTWSTLLEVSGNVITTIHIGRRIPGLILAASGSRVYRSTDFGGSWSFFALQSSFAGALIPWDIEEDLNGVLYLGTEIGTHPQPYNPPFFRSTDHGVTWESSTPPFQVAPGTVPWHVINILAHPSQPIVWAMTEFAGLYVSTDAGDSWQLTANWPISGRFLDLVLDPLRPTRFFAMAGGTAWVSTDGAVNFHYAGLEGLHGSQVFLSQSGRVLYVYDPQSGLYRAVVPASP